MEIKASCWSSSFIRRPLGCCRGTEIACSWYVFQNQYSDLLIHRIRSTVYVLPPSSLFSPSTPEEAEDDPLLDEIQYLDYRYRISSSKKHSFQSSQISMNLKPMHIQHTDVRICITQCLYLYLDLRRCLHGHRENQCRNRCHRLQHKKGLTKSSFNLSMIRSLFNLHLHCKYSKATVNSNQIMILRHCWCHEKTRCKSLVGCILRRDQGHRVGRYIMGQGT